MTDSTMVDPNVDADDGPIDFDDFQEEWQSQQRGVENGLQEINVTKKNGTSLYIKANLETTTELIEMWYNVQQGVQDTDQTWVRVTGAWAVAILLSEVESIQARPAGNFKDHEQRSRGRGRGGPRRDDRYSDDRGRGRGGRGGHRSYDDNFGNR